MKCKHCKSENVEYRGARGEGKKRQFCQDCRKWSTVKVDYKSIPKFEYLGESSERAVKKHNTFIVTSAQNNTPVDKLFWQSLLNLQKHYDAALFVIPTLYRNPSVPGIEKEDAWWPQEVIPYLIDEGIQLAPGIVVMAQVKIGATTDNPLTGLDSLSRGDSAIFGHAQIQMKTVATPQHKLPKILMTTGSTSVKSYGMSKAGIKGAFHHALGAAIVEINGDVFHIRGVVGDEKSEFYDLDLHVTAKGVRSGKRIEALVVGDEHSMFTCPDVVKATFTDSDSIVNVLKPKYIVRHDVIDAYTISHHHDHSPSKQYSKYKFNKNRLIDELELTARYIEKTTPKGSTNVIVPSNHHNHIAKWLELADWRSEPWNAKIYHEMWAAWLDAIDNGLKFHPFTWWMKNNCKADTLYLFDDYPFIVKGVYLSYHGDKGINGAKGNLRQFSKIGVKTVIGHWHSPGIEKGAYLVGTSSKLSLEYTSGPSSWLNSHCIISANGKRQIINIIKGQWRKG